MICHERPWIAWAIPRLIFAMTCLVVHSVFAQTLQQKFLEIDIDKKKGQNYYTMLLGDRGAMCVHSNAQPIDFSRREMTTTLLNTDLDTVWQQTYVVDSRSTWLGYAFNQTHGVLLLLNNRNKLDYLKIQLPDGQASEHEIRDLDKLNVSYVELAGEKLLLAGEIMENPTAVLVDIHTQEKKFLPTLNQLKAKIDNVYLDGEKGVIVVILNGYYTKERAYFVHLYSFEGELLNKFRLPRSEEYRLLTFRPHINDDAQVLIIGTYGVRFNTYSQGVYSLLIERGEQKSLRFYDFSDFKNFFNYLEPQKKAKLLKKIEKKRQKGKEYPFYYRLSVHDLELHHHQLILMAESVRSITSSQHPRHTYMRRYYPYYSPPYSVPISEVPEKTGIEGIDEYFPEAISSDFPLPKSSGAIEYQHAFVCAFDEKGTLQGDFSYAFDKTEHTYPLIVAKGLLEKDSVKFIEFRKEDFRYQAGCIDNGQSSEAKLFSLEPFVEKEKLVEIYLGGLRHWYANHFVATGVRQYFPKSPDKKEKKVYFITKVSLE